MIRALLFSACLLAHPVYSQSAWINEFHYDDAGTDSLEFVEVMIVSNLDDLRLFLYNGANGTPYDSVLLDTLSNVAYNGFRLVVWYPELIQNGPADGISLIHGDTVLHSLSYEGEFTATSGPAAGISFEQIAPSESTYTLENHSLQLYGKGSSYAHFEWREHAGASPYFLNHEQEYNTLPVLYTEPADTMNFHITPYGFSSPGRPFILRGANLTGNVVIYPPQGFEADTMEYFQTGASFGKTLEISPNGDYIPPTEVFIRFTPVEPDGLTHTESLAIVHPLASPIRVVLSGTEGLVGMPRMWINEMHYDDVSYDTLEFIEIAVQHAGRYSPEDITLHLYNGDNGRVYKNYSLEQSWQSDYSDPAWDLFVIDVPQIQNGPDGVALCYRDSCSQFISYEGQFAATDGPAFGQTSDPLPVSEDPSAPDFSSLQLVGSGKFAADFTWVYVPGNHTMGYPNTSQTLPLRLLNHEAERENKNVHVQFTTSGESVEIGYRMEYSFTGEAFDSIGWINSSRQPVSRYYFSYENGNPHYIRCVAITFEGEQRIQFTRRIPASDPSPWLLGNTYLLHHPFYMETPADILLLRSDGVVLSRKSRNLSGDKTNLGWIHYLSPGMYLLSIHLVGETHTLRFIHPPPHRD